MRVRGKLRGAPRARTTIKQMGLVFKMYANEWDGRFPFKCNSRGGTPGSPAGWAGLFPHGPAIYPEYLNDWKTLLCPSDSPVDPDLIEQRIQQQRETGIDLNGDGVHDGKDEAIWYCWGRL